MLKEYALQPDLLSNWQTCRFLLDKFGYGRGRVISRYPGKWEKMVYESLAGVKPIEKGRIVEALSRLKKVALYPRICEWNANKVWLENATMEHGKRPFCAIISKENPDAEVSVIREIDLDEDSEPRWEAETQRRIERTADQMAACADILLRNAKHIIFVDPHFNPQHERFRRPLEAFLRSAANRQAGMAIRRIEIHTGHTSAGTKEFFDRECKRRLPEIIPSGLKIRMVRWDQSHLHNRFVLTERGGLKFGTGLDDYGHGALSHDLGVCRNTQCDLDYNYRMCILVGEGGTRR